MEPTGLGTCTAGNHERGLVETVYPQGEHFLPASIPEHSQPLWGAPATTVGLKGQGTLQPCSCSQAPNLSQESNPFPSPMFPPEQGQEFCWSSVPPGPSQHLLSALAMLRR